MDFKSIGKEDQSNEYFSLGWYSLFWYSHSECMELKMTTDEIIEYCLLKSGAFIDFPFGDIPICVKVEKRLFAQIYPQKDDFKITLNCDMMTGQFYRDLYPNIVVRGYHCPPIQQPYFNTVYLNSIISDDELKKMIDHAYSVVVGKLPKSIQKKLLGLTENKTI